MNIGPIYTALGRTNGCGGRSISEECGGKEKCVELIEQAERNRSNGIKAFCKEIFLQIRGRGLPFFYSDRYHRLEYRPGHLNGGLTPHRNFLDRVKSLVLLFKSNPTRSR